MTATAFHPTKGATPIPGYRLETLLGKGGFGEVWRAQAPGGFPVALKFLAADTAASERELRSLQMLQRIRDGYLLSLFGVWQLPGFFVLAMELADGTLLDRLNACRQQGLSGVPHPELLDYFQQAARGIDFLNESRHVLHDGGQPTGIQHGDIKPQNLLLVGSLCKVGDFGLLRRLAATASQKTNSMTMAYAPPEVFDGRPSARSDQYSLAVSWCQLRGGRLPFEGTPAQIMAGHIQRLPDLTMLPEAERAGVERALSKSPEDRWASCRTFVEALRVVTPEIASISPDRVEPSLPTLHPSTTPRPQQGGVPQKGQPVTNSVGMKFVWIEPGSFLMGSPDGTTLPGRPAEEERGSDEKPHWVTLTKGYHLGVYLVTQDQWEQVMGREANHSKFMGKDNEKTKLPVDRVSWFDCVEFCIKLSEREGRQPHYRLMGVLRNQDGSTRAAEVEMLTNGTGYRLPTEAEWEYACRAGTTTPFWWGATINTDQANYDGTFLYGKDGKKGESRKRPTPVDQFKANPWGLYDMHGNLYQWCQDRYADCQSPEIQTTQRVNLAQLRGGSWRDCPRYCRAAYRDWNAPDLRLGHVGCRLVLGLD